MPSVQSFLSVATLASHAAAQQDVNGTYNRRLIKRQFEKEPENHDRQRPMNEDELPMAEDSMVQDTMEPLDGDPMDLGPVRVYMNTETSRVKAHKEREDGTFTIVDLGLIFPDLQSEGGKESLFLWGEHHVVFLETYHGARFSIMNIGTRKTKQMQIDIPYEHSLVTTLGGQLLVIGRDQNLKAYMRSYETPEKAMSGTPSVVIKLSDDRVINDVNLKFSLYGVLVDKVDDISVEKLIVVGTKVFMDSDHPDFFVEEEMFCESYDGVKWTTCTSPPHDYGDTIDFDTSIVWKNRLVALGKRYSIDSDIIEEKLYVYNHSMEGEPWSTKAVPDPPQYEKLSSQSFFLNLEDHLCLDAKKSYDDIVTYEVWCLKDLESETDWIQMPDTYVFETDQNVLIGTLPAKIILKMAAAPSLSWPSYFLSFFRSP